MENYFTLNEPSTYGNFKDRVPLLTIKNLRIVTHVSLGKLRSGVLNHAEYLDVFNRGHQTLMFHLEENSKDFKEVSPSIHDIQSLLIG